MVSRHNYGRRDEDSPVPIKSQKRERTKNVKVRLDAAPGQVDQQRRSQHLRHGDGMSGQRAARLPPNQEHGKTGNRAT